MSDTKKCNILVIEDDVSMSSTLLEVFEQYNRGDLVIPDELRPKAAVEFSAMVESNPANLGEYLKRNSDWTAFVIDRMFDEKRSWDFSAAILKSLAHLHVTNAIKIIWTAMPDCEDIVLCMRLGAWDYLSKREPRSEHTYKDVVVSILQGLKEQRERDSKVIRDQEAQDFIIQHYATIHKECQGTFAAFETVKGSWRVDPVAKSSSLFDLYTLLNSLGRDPNMLHLAWIA